LQLHPELQLPLSQERPKLSTSNLAGTFIGSIGTKQKPIKNFEEEGAWAYPGLLYFLDTPIISGTCKTMFFKFGRYIHMVDPNKIPLTILEKRERGRIQELPNFWGYPLFSQERLKLRTSNFVRTITGPIGTQAH